MKERPKTICPLFVLAQKDDFTCLREGCEWFMDNFAYPRKSRCAVNQITLALADLKYAKANISIF